MLPGMGALLALLLAAAAPPAEPDPAALRADAAAIEQIVNENYAYPERLAGGRYALTPKLRAEAQAITTKRELVRFAERAVALLADHHAITGASLKDSWAVFPSYGDLWIAARGGDFLIERVREGSPAERAGIRPATGWSESARSRPPPRSPASGASSARAAAANAIPMPREFSPLGGAMRRGC